MSSKGDAFTTLVVQLQVLSSGLVTPMGGADAVHLWSAWQDRLEATVGNQGFTLWWGDGVH
jgi:hypothetical protein